MLKTGILNPQVNALLARIRHTNRLVIADRGFPFWPEVEIVDLSLVNGIPTVQQVLTAVLFNFQAGQCWMAEEFRRNDTTASVALANLLDKRGLTVSFEAYAELKTRVTGSIGLIRTADTLPYSNVILESA